MCDLVTDEAPLTMQGGLIGEVETHMKTNEGAVDRVLRVVVGAGILSLAFVGPQTPWAYLGVIPLLTGLVGFCPLYAVLGVNTCGVRKT
jgi:hypothetical protein